MNEKMKPKEALRVLKNNIHYSLYELNEATKNNTNSRLIRSIRTLDELVDKATPKKIEEPLRLEQGLCGECPRCTAFVQNSNYCGHCGQKLDWSENDE